jgi:hypothetical protein
MIVDDKWIQVKFCELEKRMNDAFSLRDKAIDTSRMELHDRLAKMNEIREQLDEQARTFVRQDWIASQLEAILLRVNRSETAISTLAEKASEAERRLDRNLAEAEGRHNRNLIVVGLVIAAVQLLLFLLRSNGVVPS